MERELISRRQIKWLIGMTLLFLVSLGIVSQSSSIVNSKPNFTMSEIQVETIPSDRSVKERDMEMAVEAWREKLEKLKGEIPTERYLPPLSGPFKRFKRPKKLVKLPNYQGRLTFRRIMGERILIPLKILSAWSSISLCNLKTKTSDQPFKRSTQRGQVSPKGFRYVKF